MSGSLLFLPREFKVKQTQVGVSTLIGERSGTKLLFLLQTSYFGVILINMTDAHVVIVDTLYNQQWVKPVGRCHSEGSGATAVLSVKGGCVLLLLLLSN